MHMMNEIDLFAAECIDRAQHALARDARNQFSARTERAADLWAAAGLGDLHEGTTYTLACLSEAVATARPGLLFHHVEWLRVATHVRGLPYALLHGFLDALVDALRQGLPGQAWTSVEKCLLPVLARMPSMPDELPSAIAPGPLQAAVRYYLLALLENDRQAAWSRLDALRQAGSTRDAIARDVMMPAQAEVGRMWQMNELSIVEEHMASEIVEGCLDRLYQDAAVAPRNGKRVLTAAVAGNHHRVGSRWLAHAFAMAGWECVALGANVPAAELPHALAEFGCQALCLSATLTTHVRQAARAVDAVRSAPQSAASTVLVGGPPFRIVPDLWQIVGANATAEDPAAAVAIADALVPAR